jgi:uncharacterized protein (DUF58 family)
MQEELNIEEIIPKTNLGILAKQVVEGFITGLHKSPFHGFSVEFAEHRPYHPSENIRTIDWKLFGRTDKMYVKKYEEETNLRCQLVLDVSSSMYYPDKKWNKIKFSILSIASLVELLKSQRDAFGLSLFSDELKFSSIARSTTVHQKLIYAELEKVLVDKPKLQKTSIAKSLHEIAEKIHKRSLVIIFSDMFENIEEREKIFEALQHLRYNKHEVVVFHVSDHSTEIDFNFDGRPYLFVDVESGEEVKVHANSIRAEYVKRMNSYVEEITKRCQHEKIDFILSNTEKGFNEVLNSYLVKRARVY